MARCTAKSKRTGLPCKSNAVTGYKTCRMHGAGSPHKGRPGGRPPIHGAYSKAIPGQEIQTLEELRELGVGLESEVALARLQLNRAVEWSAKESKRLCSGKRCPQDLIDSRLDLVSKVAERCKRVADGILVRIVDEGAIGQVLDVIKRHVTDTELLGAIAADLEKIGTRGTGVAA